MGMELTVKTLTNVHFEIKVQSTDTVLAVKKNIEDVQGYPCGRQVLYHNGKVLKDEATLVDNKVTKDGFLVVMLITSKTSGSAGASSTVPASTAVSTAATASNPTPTPGGPGRESCLGKSQPTNQGVDDASQADKAQWDQNLTTAFVDICVDRVKAGDRPNTHFTREGWRKVIEYFFEKTGRAYDQSQLKNKWDNLRKNWRVWEKLILGETNLDWDSARETVVADNEWWERKIKQDKRCAKFRNQGIKNRESLQFLFGGQGATGLCTLIPSAREEPPVPVTVTEEGKNYVQLSQDEDSTDQEYDANADGLDDVQSTPTPPRVGNARRRSNLPTNLRRGKKCANEIRQDLNQSLVHLVSDKQSFSISSKPVPLDGSLRDVFKLLEEIPETAAGGPLLCFALVFFQKKENREYFVGINRQDWQLAWLRMKFDEVSGGGSSSMR